MSCSFTFCTIDLLNRLKFYLNNIIVTKDQLKELYYSELTPSMERSI